MPATRLKNSALREEGGATPFVHVAASLVSTAAAPPRLPTVPCFARHPHALPRSFTGGYVEARVQLPGDPDIAGFW